MKFFTSTLSTFLLYAIACSARAEETAEQDMAGKTALCIGCTRGIGEAAARQMAERGANVVVTGRSVDAGKKIADDIGGTMYECDMGDRSSLENVFEATTNKYGKIDAIFANGAIAGEGEPLEEVSPEFIESIGQVNGMANLYVYDLAIKSFSKSGGGTLVFTSSIAAFISESLSSNMPSGAFMYYAALKAITPALARTSAMLAQTHNVRVFAIAPAVYDTKMVRDIVDNSAFARKLNVSDVNSYSGFNPVFSGCAGNANDAAAVAVAMLANKTHWPPSSVVVTDGPLTFESNALSDKFGRPDSPWNDIDVSLLRDTVGAPIDITREKIQDMIAECVASTDESKSEL